VELCSDKGGKREARSSLRCSLARLFAAHASTRELSRPCNPLPSYRVTVLKRGSARLSSATQATPIRLTFD
jgi:hypothetical protein